jgi:hypothetical protein
VKTFPDLPKELTIGIDGLTGPFSDRLTSHKGAWPKLLKSQLRHLGYDAKVLTKKDRWEDFDVMVIDWGMEFRGTFNVFGGASDELAARLEQFLDYKGKLVSAHILMPPIAKFVEDRLRTGTPRFKKLSVLPFHVKQKEFDYFDHVFENDKLVLGDSHSVSAYRPGYMISRNDGATLYGTLFNKGLASYIGEKDETVPFHDIKDLVIYFGNIDVRHHLMRQGDPVLAVEELCAELERQLLNLNLERVTIVHTIPVEHEERKLPKTGFYKGTPFFGHREDRAVLGHHFNTLITDMVNSHSNDNWHFEAWPRSWYEMDPTQFAITCMEKPGSVHLSQSSYMHSWV